MTPIMAWQSFYVIVGTAAASLTGLQFVVMAVVAQTPMRTSNGAVDAFATPTIFHFGNVLLLSAMLSAPWGGVAAPTLLCSGCGAVGLVYAIIVARRARRQTDYRPTVEDWLFHVLLPGVAYALLVPAYVLRWHVTGALFAIATAAVLLLFIGIHNAWDAVQYLVFALGKKRGEDGERRGEES